MTICAMHTTLLLSMGSMRTGNLVATGMSTPVCSYCMRATSDWRLRKFWESSATRACAARSCARSRWSSRSPASPPTPFAWFSLSSLTTSRRFATSCSERDSAVTALRIAEEACWSIIWEDAVFARSAS